MNNSIVNVPNPVNEPIKDYKPGSPEKESVLATYKRLKDSKTDVKCGLVVNLLRVLKPQICLLLMIINIFLVNIILAEKKHVE